MLKSTIRALHAGSAIMLTSLLASAANAQTANDATPANGAPQETIGVGEIIVTAQKRAESLQVVPIAVSAFSQDMLQRRGLLGGADLQQAIPNVSFGATGFNRYNFQIRGIGSQIQGFSVDTGVGVHENNIPLTANRLAEAEFYDVERVEVLRGPQGTLYGRNATGGVINVITAKPGDAFSGSITGELGRYDTRRLRGFVNIPLTDTLAVRAAGTMIKRDGTSYNSGTGNFVDSRDLWSTRLTAAWKPSSNFRATAMWEHFRENDTRGGGQKVICAPASPVTSIGGVATDPLTSGLLTPGCLNNAPSDKANTGAVSSLATLHGLFGALLGIQPNNAFAGRVLSSDIREVQSSFDPRNVITSDLLSWEMELQLSDALKVTSLSSYSKDRFATESYIYGGLPTSGLLVTPITPGGVFTDPQLGTSNRLEARFLNRQNSRQYSQELRIQSDFKGPINFNLGGIYLDYKQNNDLIGMSNSVTAFAVAQNFSGAGIYIDPLATPDGTGHNYYNNKGPYRLRV